MPNTLDDEAGIALTGAGPKEGAVKSGTLLPGRFMTLDWHGHPDALENVTGMLIGWARLTNQPFYGHTEGNDDHFACRLEIYQSDPSEVPTMDDWVTTSAFKLKD